MNIVIQNSQKAECFASLFQHIRLFTDTINISFEKNRMYVQSMDSARVSIFEIDIPASWFDTYEHTNEGGITLGLSSSTFFKILNARDKAQNLNIVFDTENEDRLYVQFTCDTKAIFDKRFEIPLIDLETELMAIPDSECNAEFTLSSATFASMVNQLKMFGENLDVLCNEDKIVISSISAESGKMSVDIEIDQLTEFAINEGETLTLSFSLNMLHNICAYSKIAKEIDIKLTDNFPMKIVYRLDADTEAKMMFYLAPKVNDD